MSATQQQQPPAEVRELIVSKVGLAARLGYSTDTLERRIKAGLLPPGFRLGRQVYWHLPTVLAAIEASARGVN